MSTFEFVSGTFLYSGLILFVNVGEQWFPTGVTRDPNIPWEVVKIGAIYHISNTLSRGTAKYIKYPVRVRVAWQKWLKNTVLERRVNLEECKIYPF